MNWRQRILADWPNDPQRNHKAKEALRQIDDSLSTLASLGHPLHIEEGYVSPPPPEWPKAVFHVLQGTRVVQCQADLDELGPDWYTTMEDARYAAGLTKQLQRGGIFSKSLPSMLTRTEEDKELMTEQDRAEKQAKELFVQEQRALHRARSNGSDLPTAKRNARQI